MRPVPQRIVETMFKEGRATDLTIRRLKRKSYYLTFRCLDLGEAGEVFTIGKQRGEIRDWADPRWAFDFILNRLGIRAGHFLIEDMKDDEQTAKKK
jgi:hypothetical protein